MTKEFYTELCHSAKGTSWKKKDHKYLKLIDGRYYYATKKQIDNIKQTTDSLSIDQINYDDVNSKYQNAKSTALSLTKKSFKEYQKAAHDDNSKWRKPFAESHRQASKSAKADADHYRELATKYKDKTNMLAKSMSDKNKRLEYYTVSYKVKSWVDNLLSKFKK